MTSNGESTLEWRRSLLRHKVGEDEMHGELAAEGVLGELLAAEVTEDVSKASLLQSESISKVHSSTLVTHRDLPVE